VQDSLVPLLLSRDLGDPLLMQVGGAGHQFSPILAVGACSLGDGGWPKAVSPGSLSA
jgi:hypothetical protein